jgi:hypothetical protein
MLTRALTLFLQSMKRFLTLDSILSSLTLDKTLHDHATFFWKHLFYNFPDDKHPPVDEARIDYCTTSSDMARSLQSQSGAHISCRNDEGVMNAVMAMYAKHRTETPRLCIDIRLSFVMFCTSKALFGRRHYQYNYRPVSSRTGIHIYIAFVPKGDRSDISA